MEKPKNLINLNFTDAQINGLLRTNGNGAAPATMHYNQNEEFFLKFSSEFFVPSFPIHHDVRKTEPDERYLETLKMLLQSIVPLAPQVFEGLTYFFDPSDTLRPGFFQLYRLGDNHYVYMVKLDLIYKPSEHQVIQASTNDATPEYRSSKLFLDGVVVPLESVQLVDNRISGFSVLQTVSQTWIGETGRGYFLQGIWMDYELTKFFSKLFLPQKKRTYPYYPFQCRYRTICSTVINTGIEDRRKTPPILHRAVKFVTPIMSHIENSLRNGDFSEDLDTFVKLKQKVPEFWNSVWESFNITPYLNEQDMKEFVIEV